MNYVITPLIEQAINEPQIVLSLPYKLQGGITQYQRRLHKFETVYAESDELATKKLKSLVYKVPITSGNAEFLKEHGIEEKIVDCGCTSSPGLKKYQVPMIMEQK